MVPGSEDGQWADAYEGRLDDHEAAAGEIFLNVGQGCDDALGELVMIGPAFPGQFSCVFYAAGLLL